MISNFLMILNNSRGEPDRVLKKGSGKVVIPPDFCYEIYFSLMSFSFLPARENEAKKCTHPSVIRLKKPSDDPRHLSLYIDL